jgi:hypothetical protein
MPGAGYDQRFDQGLGAFVQKLHATAANIPEFLKASLKEIAQGAAERAAELTPRSDGPGPHLADGWKVEEQAAGTQVRYIVRNEDPRANEPMELADGTKQPYTLLHILEYGSAPHEIRPVNARFLRFFWPRVGKTVYAQLVEHPGTRPYSMLTIAGVEAAIQLKQAVDAARAAIRLGGQRGRFFSPNRRE